MVEARLLLWGFRAVGKTTLLSTGLLAYRDRLPPIDWTAEPLGEKRKVLDLWLRLKRNEGARQTASVTALELSIPAVGRLIIRDIPGLLTRQPLEEESFLKPGQAQGVLFVCEWKGPDIANDMAAVESALHFCRDFKVGLAITKSERGLDADDPHWHAPPHWWREHDCWRRYGQVLEAFDDRVWPTSAFGFDADGRPASLLDEFGQVMPYAIAPLNVEAPFRWFFKELGLWPDQSPFTQPGS